MNAVFLNRQEAGNRLASKLTAYQDCPQAIVLGLPRGGVLVAYEIAKSLKLPFDVCLVKKLGLPGYEETAMGAIAEDALIHDYDGNITIIDRNLTQRAKVDRLQIQAVAAKVKAELRWREHCYRNYRPMLEIKDKIVIVADDGIATGLTMHAAVIALRKHQPQKIVLAIPVALEKTLRQFVTLVDDIVCLITPESMGAVGFWYEDFSQVSDREVCEVLAKQSQTSAVSDRRHSKCGMQN